MAHCGLPIFRDNGLTAFMHGVRREASCSTWIRASARLTANSLFVFNQFGDLERCSPRPGNVNSADGWDGVLKPVVARYQGNVSRIYFRADAGFANPEVYECLEAEGIKYAIPASRQQGLAGEDRLSADVPGWTTPERGAVLLREFHLSGRKVARRGVDRGMV
jgi:hypothetical protein